MLLSQVPSPQCSFDTTVTCLKQLANFRPWEKDRGSADFGGWVESGPRKRKNRCKEHHLSQTLDLESKTKLEKMSSKLQTSNIYYKRYRVDPLEGTFKHYKNIEQYMQLYRETTTLCFKQKTLNELTAMYSSALDINSKVIKMRLSRLAVEEVTPRDYVLPNVMDVLPLPKVTFLDVADILSNEHVTNEHQRKTNDYKDILDTRTQDCIKDICEDDLKRQTVNGYTYNLDSEAVGKWDANCQLEEYLTHPLTIPPITSRLEGGVPLMLLPSAPSIPHRTQYTNQPTVQSPIAQASFMCNAYMNKTIVCPVHRIIHRKSSLLINNGRVRSHLNEINSTPDEHVKVTLPGIPRRSREAGGNSTPEGTPPRSSSVRDEGEDEADERINQLLSNTQTFADPCERISKVLQQQQQQRRPVPSMQLPVTALLQYNPDVNGLTKPRPIKKPSILRNRQSRVLQEKKKSREAVKPKLEVKQLMNYEKEYERFFSDVLESKGRSSQKRHFQNMSSKT